MRNRKREPTGTKQEAMGFVILVPTTLKSELKRHSNGISRSGNGFKIRVLELAGISLKILLNQ